MLPPGVHLPIPAVANHVPPDPEKEFAVISTEKVATEGQLLKWVRTNRSAKRQVLIFVHGFNNTYADAVFRFAQIVHDAGTPLPSSSHGRRVPGLSTIST